MSLVSILAFLILFVSVFLNHPRIRTENDWVSYPVVSNTTRPHYCQVAKPSPSFAGNPALVRLGAVIRAERQAQGLSQEALADKANIDRSYMGGIERGEHNLAIMNLLKVADALGMKASLLLEKSD